MLLNNSKTKSLLFLEANFFRKLKDIPNPCNYFLFFAPINFTFNEIK
jgi:hypothetical protein